MDEVLRDKIIEWLESLTTLAGETVPEFVQEVARYGFMQSAVTAVIMSVIVICMTAFAICYWSVDKNDYGFTDTVVWPIGFMVYIVLWVGILCNVESCIKAKVSPKLYFIERFVKK